MIKSSLKKIKLDIPKCIAHTPAANLDKTTT